MQARETSRLVETLEADPDDLDAWLALGRQVERTGEAPAFDEALLYLAQLQAAWALAPEVRGLAAVLLPALGLAPLEGSAPGPWWSEQGRLGAGPGPAFDAASGLPLRARRVEDGAEMALVPAGRYPRGQAGEEWAFPEHEVSLSAFYLDVLPLGAGQLAAWRRDVTDPDRAACGARLAIPLRV